MTANRKRFLIVASVLVAGIAVAVSVRWWQNRSDSSLIAGLLKIEALPHGTRIMEIRKDLLPDTVVEAHLVIPAGMIGKLVSGIPLEERTVEHSTRSSRYGVVMTQRWERHFTNADFTVECDETGRQVHVICAVD